MNLNKMSSKKTTENTKHFLEFNTFNLSLQDLIKLYYFVIIITTIQFDFLQAPNLK